MSAFSINCYICNNIVQTDKVQDGQFADECTHCFQNRIEREKKDAEELQQLKYISEM